MAHKPSIEQAAVIGLMRVADRLRRHFAAVLEPYDLTLQQFNVLRILRGSEPAGLPTLAIAARMIEQTPGITRLVDRLVRKALVARCPGERDRRVVVCRISPKGLKLLARLDDPIDQADVSAVDALEPRDRARLVALLGPLHREPA